MSDNVAQLSEAISVMRTKDVEHLVNRIKKLESTIAGIISEYDEPDNGRYLRWEIDIAREVLMKGKIDD